MATEIKKFMAAKKDATLHLYVYGEIGANWMGDGITPDSVQSAIKESGAFDSITVHVNSPGGDSFDGMTIHNILRQQGVPVRVIVEGYACSAAFTISMAGDSIAVCDGGVMMCHNAWSIAVGDSKEMRTTADLLDKISGTLCDVYAKRSGIAADEVQALMDATTWMTGPEAVERGFASETLSTTPTKEAAALAASFDLSKFCARVPDALKAKAESEQVQSANENGCECECEACQMDECTNCALPGCTDAKCDEARMSATAEQETIAAACRVRMSRQMRIAELTAPQV